MCELVGHSLADALDALDALGLVAARLIVLRAAVCVRAARHESAKAYCESASMWQVSS